MGVEEADLELVEEQQEERVLVLVVELVVAEMTLKHNILYVSLKKGNKSQCGEVAKFENC